MTKYEVSYISGNSLKFKTVEIEANSSDDAVSEAFEREGQAFENRLVSVKEIE